VETALTLTEFKVACPVHRYEYWSPDHRYEYGRSHTLLGITGVSGFSFQQCFRHYDAHCLLDTEIKV
jgi:hypothetical protein